MAESMSDRWTPRIGPAGYAALRRGQRQQLQSGLIFVVLVAVAVTVGLLNGPPALLLLLVPGLAAVAVAYGAGVRSIIEAQREGIAFCGLPPAGRKWLPVRSSVDFDLWLSLCGTPYWPSHWRQQGLPAVLRQPVTLRRRKRPSSGDF